MCGYRKSQVDEGWIVTELASHKLQPQLLKPVSLFGKNQISPTEDGNEQATSGNCVLLNCHRPFKQGWEEMGIQLPAAGRVTLLCGVCHGSGQCWVVHADNVLGDRSKSR